MKQTESKISSNFKGRKKTKGGMYRGNKKKLNRNRKPLIRYINRSKNIITHNKYKLTKISSPKPKL